MTDIQQSHIPFGIFDHLDASGQDIGAQYADRIRLAQACDAAGFYAYHLAEHHSTPHGLAPSPNILLSAIAQRTTGLRVGPLVMLLNFYHPLRVFEEICMLDQLSGGRVDFGIGRGASPIELGFYGVSLEESKERYEEAAQIILGAMTAETITFHGRHFTLDDVPVTLSPVQRPHPPLWYGVARAQTAAWAAESGMNIVCRGSASEIRTMTDSYRARWLELHDASSDMPMLGMVRHIVIADTDEDAHRLAAPAYERWYETLNHLGHVRGLSPVPGQPATFHAAMKEGQIIAGEAATVRRVLEQQIAEAGATYILCGLAFGNLSLAASLSTISALQAEVMPAFRQKII
jgi:alkanesulfonate monooxygenase SsuD/methylene tetrahydromethanopterin reductase-like flavin-dependent oxidoreductase (luciferase family)